MPDNQQKNKWRVAVISNIKDKSLPLLPDSPPDAYAEFDKIETVEFIQHAIESDGHETKLLVADKSLPHALDEYKPDICFNIAEGLQGDAREAQTPAILEMLGIPYTHSRVLTNAISLDKVLTKRIWRDNGLPTAAFQEFATGEEPLLHELAFPLFVKPACEGSGMGIDEHSIVHSETEMRDRVKYVIATYKQPALVETYLPGREFTVGLLGGPHTQLFSRHPEWYNEFGFHHLPVLELDSADAVTPGIYGFAAKAELPGDEGAPKYICPTDIDHDLEIKLQQISLQAHLTLGALDVSRVDIRLDKYNNPQLTEINPFPGLTPGYSDICIQSAAEGIAYEDLILEILYLAAGRWGILESRNYLASEYPKISVSSKQVAK